MFAAQEHLASGRERVGNQRAQDGQHHVNRNANNDICLLGLGNLGHNVPLAQSDHRVGGA